MESESGSSSSSSRRRRMLKLLCPSVSKGNPVEIPVVEDARIDLGFISRMFGLDPDTVKLNRHFISRGVDLLSSSLTWKSLLSYFASRGLPTDALIVHGKLSKSGTKRAHNPWCGENLDCSSISDEFLVKRCPELDIASNIKKKKMNSNSTVNHVSSSGKDGDDQKTMYGGFSFKRKATIEDADVVKKKRMADSNKSGCQVGFADSITGYNCISGIKRPRGDEPIMPIIHKRVR